jgi:hypothetical protein
LGPSSYFDGVIDEVRYTTALLTAEWLSAEHSNQSDPNTFYLVGAQEEVGGEEEEEQIFRRRVMPF